MSHLEDHLTRAYWHLVAHRSEVAQPGDYVRLDWPLGELVLFNDEGAPVAFDNVCPHRGGLFFSQDSGNGRATCPYHGWSFRGGEMRPSRRDLFQPCDLQRAKLNTYRTEWWGDFLFVGVEPRADLATQLGEMGPEIKALSTDIGERRDFYRMDFESNWRVAVENALESYHVNIIHPQTLAPFGLTDERDAFAGVTSAYYATVGAARRAKGLKALKRFFDVSNAFEGYCTYFVFPYAMISSTYGYTYAVQNFFPSADPDRTQFYTRLLASRPSAGSSALTQPLIDSTIAASRQIFAEDNAICRRVSRSFDLDSPDRIYAASEARIRHFVDNLARARAEATTPARHRRAS